MRERTRTALTLSTSMARARSPPFTIFCPNMKTVEPIEYPELPHQANATQRSGFVLSARVGVRTSESTRTVSLSSVRLKLPEARFALAIGDSLNVEREYRFIFARGIYSIFRAPRGALLAIVDCDEDH